MAGGKFTQGTGSRTKAGVTPKPLADKAGNKKGAPRRTMPRGK